MSRYNDLMIKRVTWYDRTGFEPVEIHDWLFEHQKKLVDYALRKGRAALFADTGLGKTAMELSWSDNVARHTNGQVLLVTPLAVARQIEDEAVRFGIDAAISRTGKPSKADITIQTLRTCTSLTSKNSLGFASTRVLQSKTLTVNDAR